jgi:hypothetical protein
VSTYASKRETDSTLADALVHDQETFWAMDRAAL